MRSNFAHYQVSTAFMALCLAAAAACTSSKRSHWHLRAEPATCETTCAHYQQCKEKPDTARQRACRAECRSIFSENGKLDERSLREIQALDCEQLLSFIEGAQARPLGAKQD